MMGDAELRTSGKASVSGSGGGGPAAATKPRKPIQGRRKLFDIPCGVYEIPGRPHMVFKVQDYDTPDRPRREIPFLFQAFEAGQEPPPGMKTSASKRNKSRPRDLLAEAESSKRQRTDAASASVSTTMQGGGSVAESRAPQNGGTDGDPSAFVPTHPPVVPAAGSSDARPATIHEYLDWTVTAKCTRPNFEEDDELDFEGFRVVTVCGRHRPAWPRPGAANQGSWSAENEKIKLPWMGETLPPLSVGGGAYSAATLRSGYGRGEDGGEGRHWIEVPFFATAPTKRGRGYGRCLLDAIEHICQVLDVNSLHLCSTNDPTTTKIWKKLGFTDDEGDVKENLAACGLTLKGPGLLHMDNTVQMHKHVGGGRGFRRIRISHKAHRQVLYFSDAGEGGGGGEEGKVVDGQ